MKTPTPAAEAMPSVRRALEIAEAALADIGDADREPGDDLAWCERRAAEALPVVRAALVATSAHVEPRLWFLTDGEDIDGDDPRSDVAYQAWHAAHDAFNSIGTRGFSEWCDRIRLAVAELLKSPLAHPPAAQPVAPAETPAKDDECDDEPGYFAKRLERSLEDLFDAEYITLHRDFLQGCATALREASAPAQPVAPARWLPIETAPIGDPDSAPLHAIVAAPLDSGVLYVEEAWYDEQRNEWWPANVDYGDPHGDALYPTHWMPLPATPSAEAQPTPKDAA